MLSEVNERRTSEMIAR